MTPSTHPPVVLFGYDSSPFTNKVRLALRLKGIPFSYIPVPSMMPRPLLAKTFAVMYRRIPILAIGREIYCDTSLIIEALEHYFPPSQGWGTVYPKCEGIGDWMYRGMARGFASFWSDKPFFRTTTGLIPVSVWSSDFGRDRSQLIGHTIDPQKLGQKIPQNLSNLDLHLSLLEPMFKDGSNKWAFPTEKPSLVDISLYYQLRWGIDIAAGKGIYNLTGGGTKDTAENVTDKVFNEERYPGLWIWFHALESFLDDLPDLEIIVDGEGTNQWKDALRASAFWSDDKALVPSAAKQHPSLDAERGLVPGVTVIVAPDDTGRSNPTVGELVQLGIEEVVIKPMGAEIAEIDCRIHFPRLGFVIKLLDGSKL